MAEHFSLRRANAFALEPRADAAADHRAGRHGAFGMRGFERRASAARDDAWRSS